MAEGCLTRRYGSAGASPSHLDAAAGRASDVSDGSANPFPETPDSPARTALLRPADSTGQIVLGGYLLGAAPLRVAVQKHTDQAA